MDDLLPTAFLLLFLGAFLFTWLDWRKRMKRVGGPIEPSWECPHCGIVNEADRAVCWSCGAGITGRIVLGIPPGTSETWRCGRCGAWNATSRRSCWSCANVPSKAPKRSA